MQVAPVVRRDHIQVGVSFRPDQKGLAHLYDLEGIRAAVGVYLQQHVGKTIDVVPLPPDARGENTPERTPRWSDLDDIDLIVIPGAPTANTTQIATSVNPKLAQEEQEFNQPKKNFQIIEHDSRAAYELRLIAMARTIGIPVLAICAGSWRLLEGYGGVVRTLPVGQRELHKAKNTPDTWKIKHGLKIKQKTLLHELTGFSRLPETNSTHWAVAVELGRHKLKPRSDGNEDPNEMLQITARARTQRGPHGKKANTVEGFETRFGVPQVGIQWHPESNLPGMPGFDTATRQQREASVGLFSGLLDIASVSRVRRTMMNELMKKPFIARLQVALGFTQLKFAEELYADIEEYYGGPPSEREIKSYLIPFNIYDF